MFVPDGPPTDMAMRCRCNNHSSTCVHTFSAGHAILVDKLAHDCYKMAKDAAHYFLTQRNAHRPASMICSVGGGLLNGRNAWHKHVSVIAAETVGADRLLQSFRKGQLVTLDASTSVATIQGALQRVVDL